MAFTISINDQAAFEVLFAGPAGPTGPQGPQGIQGVPGQGVPVGGTTGQVLAKVDGVNYNTEWITPQDEYAVWGGITGTLSAQLDLQAALDGKYSTTNPDGFITASALTPYLTISSAASTYQPLSGMSSYLTKAGNLTGLTDLATARDNLQLGTSYSPTFAGLTIQGAGANVAQLSSTALTLNHTGYGAFSIQPSSGITFPDSTVQTTAFTAALLSGYATESWVTAGFAPLARGLPASGTVGQVLTKNSGTSYDASWATLIPGDRYLTNSTTSNSVSNGNKTFTIGTGLSYTPTQNITISYDSSHHMHGEVLTYNSGTGLLTVDINNHTGTGTYAVWTVNVGGVTPATSVAWGAITGTLGNQTDLDTALNAKLEITDAASTYQTISGMSSYLSKAGNLSGLASTSTARTNLGLGTISTFNDAPSNGSTYGRQNGAWVVAGGGGTWGSITGTLSSQTDLQSALNLKSNLASPTFTGTPLSTTAAVDTNTTQIATTAFVIAQASSSTPIVDGTAAVGTSLRYARANHVHPTDTSRAALNSPAFTGTPSLPTGTTGVTQPIGTNNTSLATTAYVKAALPTVQVSSQALRPLSVACVPSFCVPIFYPARTDILNGGHMQTFTYSDDTEGNPTFTFSSGFNYLTSVNIAQNELMTAPPAVTSLGLAYINVSSNASMTAAPSLLNMTSLEYANIYNNTAMVTAPNFSGCSSLHTANVYDNSAMTDAPNFTGCTQVTTINVNNCYIDSATLLTMCGQIHAAGSIGGTLTMTGDNMGYFDGQDLPTSAVEIQNLIDNGWTVYFNDSNPP